MICTSSWCLPADLLPSLITYPLPGILDIFHSTRSLSETLIENNAHKKTISQNVTQP